MREEVLHTLLPPGAMGDRDVPAYWTQVMSDTISSDILDYLARDAYFTGLRLGIDPRIRLVEPAERQRLFERRLDQADQPVGKGRALQGGPQVDQLFHSCLFAAAFEKGHRGRSSADGDRLET